MKNIILILLIYLSSIGVSYGQIKVVGNVYSDSSLTKPISKVKVILKFDDKTEVYKTDKTGKFTIDSKLKKFSLKIEKENYISVTFEEIVKDINFDVILRKALSVEDKDYEGSSKVIIKN